jgi:hypothetical protein
VTGTFWAVRRTSEAPGTVWHFGAAGEVLSESSIRGSVQFSFRINSAGIISAAFGQGDKVGLFNAATAFGEHPYYPQSVMGAGINGNYKEHATPFESCESPTGVVPGEPKVCGIYSGEPSEGQWGPNGLSYPDDIVPLAAGLHVSEYLGDEYGASISFVRLGVGGSEVEFRFGPPGSGAGGIDRPTSIVRDPASGDLYVSEEGNRRIDVFDPVGNFVAAFGFGVRDGADTFESCTAETGCQAGVPYAAGPHSLFTRLDFGPEGDLYAYEPMADQVQVFGLGNPGPIPPSPPLPPPPFPPGGSSGSGGTLPPEVELPGLGGHLLFVGGDDDLVGAEGEDRVALAGRGGEGDDVGAERVGELDAEVAEPADPDHAHLAARASSGRSCW